MLSASSSVISEMVPDDQSTLRNASALGPDRLARTFSRLMVPFGPPSNMGSTPSRTSESWANDDE